MNYENRIVSHFERAILRAKTTLALHDFIKKEAPPALDASDLLRSSIVLAISSLDYLMHQVIRFEIEDRILRKRPTNGITIPIQIALLDEAMFIKGAGLHIKNVNGYKSFVNPAKISEALKCIIDDPWLYISLHFGEDAKAIKTRLTLIVDLRNRIAHEGDLDPENLIPQSYEIDRDDVKDSIDFIEKLGAAIVGAVKAKSGEFV